MEHNFSRTRQGLPCAGTRAINGVGYGGLLTAQRDALERAQDVSKLLGTGITLGEGDADPAHTDTDRLTQFLSR